MSSVVASNGRLAAAVVAVIASFGLVVQVWLMFEKAAINGTSAAGVMLLFFSYFTLCSNLLVALSTTFVAFTPGSRIGQFFSRPAVQAAIGVYISFVGIGYNLLLRHMWSLNGWDRAADETIHVITPLVYVLYWLFFVQKGSLRWIQALSWLVFPIAYVTYAMARGAVTDTYPYPFIDAGKLGYLGALAGIGTFTIVFAVLGFCFIAFDYFIGKRRMRPTIG